MPLIVQIPTLVGATVNFGAFGTFMAEWNYIVGFVLGFIVYIPMMKMKVAQASLITEEEHETFTERASN